MRHIKYVYGGVIYFYDHHESLQESVGLEVFANKYETSLKCAFRVRPWRLETTSVPVDTEFPCKPAFPLPTKSRAAETPQQATFTEAINS